LPEKKGPVAACGLAEPRTREAASGRKADGKFLLYFSDDPVKRRNRNYEPWIVQPTPTALSVCRRSRRLDESREPVFHVLEVSPMLHGRRMMGFLFLALMVLPFAGLDLFGQAKDDKKTDDKKTEQKKDDKKKDDKKDDKKKDDKKDDKKADQKKEGAKDPTKTTLAWKFEKNKTFYQTMKTHTEQTMKVMNNDVTQKQDQTFIFSWTPLEEKDGKWTLEQKILGVKMDIDIGGSPIKYDSTSAAAGNASNPLSEFFKALVGSTFKVTIDPKTLKISKIEGRDEFVKKLVNANKQMQPLLDKILSEDALREMAEPTFAVVPNETVEKGKTWTKTTTLDMGPIGKYKNEYTYKYEGTEKNL